MTAVQYRSEEISFDTAPEQIQSLHAYWRERCKGDAFPDKEAILPWELPEQLGRICLIEVRQEPLDFIYRLDGTYISAASFEDLKGKSILDGTPHELYRYKYNDLKAAYEAARPVLQQVEYAHDDYHYIYMRAVFPLTHKSPGDMLMTFGYSLETIDGIFEKVR